jgi:hypothetical protein
MMALLDMMQQNQRLLAQQSEERKQMMDLVARQGDELSRLRISGPPLDGRSIGGEQFVVDSLFGFKVRKIS